LKDILIQASHQSLSPADAAIKINSVISNQLSDKEIVHFYKSNNVAITKLIDDVRIEYSAKKISQVLDGMSPSVIQDILSKIKK